MLVGRLLAPLAPPLCAGCGAWAGAAEPLCGDCRGLLRWLRREPAFLGAVAVWAPVAYDGPARALVRALKFRGAAGAAELMAAQIVANAPPPLLDVAALVPVPPHAARRRRRGYDQAELIAAALSPRAGLPVAACLERRGAAATQVGRGRAERLAGVAGTIAAAADVPERALLVDDVLTTGGTLMACAAALRAAGARRVAAVAYARTPGR
jgi:ComF family protein